MIHSRETTWMCLKLDVYPLLFLALLVILPRKRPSLHFLTSIDRFDLNDHCFFILGWKIVEMELWNWIFVGISTGVFANKWSSHFWLCKDKAFRLRVKRSYSRVRIYPKNLYNGTCYLPQESNICIGII